MRELDRASRQFPDNSEGLGIAIEDALAEADVHIGKLWGPGTAADAAGKPDAPAVGDVPVQSNNDEPSIGTVLFDRGSLKAMSNAIVAKKKKEAAVSVGPEGGDEKLDATGVLASTITAAAAH